MATVVFQEPTASRVWSNVADHLHLLEGVRQVTGLGTATAELKARLVAFICTAAYGYTRVHDARYGSWARRFAYLLAVHPNTYRLHLADEPLAVEFALGGRTERVEFGRVHGCTAVLPLTASGYRAYMNNEVRLTELDHRHLSVWRGDRHVERHLVVTGAFHIPSLPGMDAAPEDRRVLRDGAPGVVCTLARQVALFLPYLSVSGSGSVTRAGGATGELPVIVCPLTGLGMGGQLIEKLGFVPAGTDAGGRMVKHVLDFAAANAPDTPPARRNLIRNAVRGLARFAQRDPGADPEEAGA